MSVFHNNILAGASGAGGAGEATYVDDVFSTFLYEGDGSSQTINNGIDLSGEGGLVWCKNRNDTVSHILQDTERGTNALESNSNSAQFAYTTGISSFTSSGFTVGVANTVNGSGKDICSWTFRKAPGFFDIVTYTGNGSNRAIAHNLGSKPGFMIIKNLTDSNTYWRTYHVSRGATKSIVLSQNFAENDFDLIFNDTEPTSTHFTVGTHNSTNGNGDSFVAYLFANDDQSFGTNSDEAIIKCGSYSGTNSNGNFVNLGFEPQWVLTKNTNRSANWSIWDNMRGVMVSSANDVALHPNTTSADNAVGNVIDFNSTGFTLNSGSDLTNWVSGDTFIYVAIRRPNKPPTAGTNVFNANTTGSGTLFTTGFNVDWAMTKGRVNGSLSYVGTRLTGNPNWLRANTTTAETNSLEAWEFDHSNSFLQEQIGTNAITWTFARAPGFFDVVCFTSANTSTQTVSHNLGAVPEFFVVKKRDSTSSWQSYHASLGNTQYVKWDLETEAVTSSARWNNTTPTATQFTLGSQFNDSNDYVALLFATLPGISKVGSYAGTGNNIDVDCGFTAGARFVLIKRTDTDLSGSTGDWYIYDSVRGIASGNDPYLFLNETSAEVTNTDYIDPLNSGFTVTSSAPVGLNASGGTYIFLAIA